MRRGFWIFCLWLSAAALGREVGLQWASDGQNVLITWTPRAGQRMRLYRSTQPFEPEDLNNPTFPICKIPLIEGATTYLDMHVAGDAEYFYAGQSDDQWWFRADPVRLPTQALPEDLEDAWLLIDKLNYCLEVRSHGQMLKRYPVTFGTNPQCRKLVQDRASTPEGRYQICGVQPNAKWYKAFDLNYPNRADRARHKLLGGSKPIGGEIQIHGGGIEDNWTWGCIALRNNDMDELFSRGEIGQDTVVWIVGRELTYQDLELDEQASVADPLELGKWQRRHNVPVTCLQDRTTRQRLSQMRSQR